jgi:selenide,water dikinase
VPTDDNVLVGLDRADDAGVYRISEELALIQTVDFFTPVVDDPFAFGQIAAANALSDVYAMGGVPKTAMNLVAFPVRSMDIAILRRIIEGGLDKLGEAGVVLIGGHSIEDRELKYGLTVTGVIDPRRILTKRDLRPGDRMVLTKPLGTGIVNTAIKAGLAPPTLAGWATRLMARLNREAAQVMARHPVHACTDLTGFGLLGHLAEMVEGSGCCIELWAERIPLIPEALEYAAMGLIPAGTYANREFRAGMVEMAPSVPRALSDVLFDPQTSGGLLMAVAEGAADRLLGELRAADGLEAAIVGQVLPGPEETIRVR